MKLHWLVVGLAALGVVAADPALARVKKKAKPQCIDRPVQFSWHKFFNGPAPRPNGCSPPVFVNGEFIGQDPDPRIRFQLMRVPETGYKQNH